MLRDECRVNAVDHGPHSIQMLIGESAGRPQAQPYSMQAEGIVRTQVVQYVPVPAGLIEVVLGMDLEPVDGRPLLEEFAVVK